MEKRAANKRTVIPHNWEVIENVAAGFDPFEQSHPMADG